MDSNSAVATENSNKPTTNKLSGVERKEINLTKKQLQDEKSKDSKFLVELNKTLINLTPEEKSTYLFEKYVEQIRSNRRVETGLKQNEKVLNNALKEKELISFELNKTAITKSKLESLCRELQKCNKEIKEESLQRIKEEEEKRRETQTKFQKSLNEITVMMNENNEKNKTLRDDNMEMSKKFQYILEQYEIREKQIEKVNKQLDLSSQLNDARMAKLQMEKSVEKEIMLREKAELLTELEKSKKQIVELSTKEQLLREQLNIYSEKYQDFQSSIQKSNNVFVGYKTEIEKMSKNMKKIEKESTTWRMKFEKSNAALLDLISEKQVRDEHITKTAKQLFYLQKLCRTLQAERTVLIQALKDNNIECPAIPEPLPGAEPEPIVLPNFSPAEKIVPEKSDRLDTMTKNCVDLKQNLKQLQDQLASMSDEKEVAVKEAAAAQKKSKNKARKNKNTTKSDKANDGGVAVAEKSNKVTDQNLSETVSETGAVTNVDNSDLTVAEPPLKPEVQSLEVTEEKVVLPIKNFSPVAGALLQVTEVTALPIIKQAIPSLSAPTEKLADMIIASPISPSADEVKLVDTEKQSEMKEVPITEKYVGNSTEVPNGVTTITQAQPTGVVNEPPPSSNHEKSSSAIETTLI